MKGDPVPDTDHIARYCGGASVHEDGSISGVAFRLRRLKDGGWEQFLSVNWLELLESADRERQLAELRRIFAGKRFDLRPKARFAVLNVGEVRQHVHRESDDRRNLQILHEPEPDDASHSGLFGLGPEDDLIADLIAEAVREVHPVQA